MTTAAPQAIAVAKVLDQVMRSDRGRLLASLVAGLRNLSLAEEALQEASVSAMSQALMKRAICAKRQNI